VIYKFAITGKMGTGKSTMCKRIVAALEPSVFVTLKFAKPIYDALSIFGQEKKHRRFMQQLGDIARFNFGDDIFEQLFEKQYSNFIDMAAPYRGQTVVLACDDCRFMGEYTLLKRLGFLVIKLVTDDVIRRQRISTWGNTGHRSETELDSIPADICFYNDGPVERLDDHLPHIIRAWAKLNEEHDGIYAGRDGGDPEVADRKTSTGSAGMSGEVASGSCD